MIKPEELRELGVVLLLDDDQDVLKVFPNWAGSVIRAAAASVETVVQQLQAFFQTNVHNKLIIIIAEESNYWMKTDSIPYLNCKEGFHHAKLKSIRYDSQTALGMLEDCDSEIRQPD